MGRVLDYRTGSPVSNATLKLSSAVELAFDPEGAPALAKAISDSAGLFDLMTEEQPDDPFGIVYIVTGNSLHVTATGTLSNDGTTPPFGPMTSVRDVWTIQNADLEEWSESLSDDDELEQYLPLTERGGVLGIVRGRESGEPLSDVEIVPEDPDSEVEIRYLKSDGEEFNDNKTSDHGRFLLLGAAPGESFEAWRDDEQLDVAAQRAGMAGSAMFSLAFNIEGI
jgi:hypothetical protein